MKVLVACEFSGKVRNAFLAMGHDAYSCDLIPSEDCVKSNYFTKHFIMDCFQVIDLQKWDMLIAFPPCTHLAVSGARYFKDKIKDGRQMMAINFFMKAA